MEQTTFDDLWTLMSKYTFKMETDSLMTDFSCIICNKIMIDACVSNCGCKYCYKCLNEYLSGENKYCPGDKADCKEVKLVYGISYMRNNLINNKILNVKVHCPFESCEFTDKIIKIEDHLKICSKQISDCPYISLGCHHKESKDRIIHHLYDYTLEHTNVLINYVENINKEKCDLKEDLEMCKREIKFLKEDSQLKIKNIIIEQGKMMETLSFNIKEIKEQLQKKEIQIIQLIDEGKCFKEELRKKDVYKASNVNRVNMSSSSSHMNILEERINMLTKFINTENEFIWKVDQMSVKVKEARMGVRAVVYSDPFYSHKYGYKLRLSMHPNGYGSKEGTHLYVLFSVMKGEYDDLLSWPLKRAVLLSIIDRNDGHDYCSYRFVYDDTEPSFRGSFMKPTTNMNMAMGNDEFVKLDCLFQYQNILREDNIFIKCVLSL